jgi:hypothetical protein
MRRKTGGGKALERIFHLGYKLNRVRWFFGTSKFCRKVERVRSLKVTAKKDRE